MQPQGVVGAASMSDRLRSLAEDREVKAVVLRINSPGGDALASEQIRRQVQSLREAGKTVVVFALPGAFTPTCSSTHVPRYNQLAPALKRNGVDEVICISVNDTFVMNEWAKDQESQNVRLIPDGNGEFSEQIGMLVDNSIVVYEAVQRQLERSVDPDRAAEFGVRRTVRAILADPHLSALLSDEGPIASPGYQAPPMPSTFPCPASSLIRLASFNQISSDMS